MIFNPPENVFELLCYGGDFTVYLSFLKHGSKVRRVGTVAASAVLLKHIQLVKSGSKTFQAFSGFIGAFTKLRCGLDCLGIGGLPGQCCHQLCHIIQQRSDLLNESVDYGGELIDQWGKCRRKTVFQVQGACGKRVHRLSELSCKGFRILVHILKSLCKRVSDRPNQPIDRIVYERVEDCPFELLSKGCNLIDKSLPNVTQLSADRACNAFQPRQGGF